MAEFGFTQSPASLAAAAHWWLESAGTTVKLAITINMKQTTHELEVVTWGLRSTVIDTNTITTFNIGDGTSEQTTPLPRRCLIDHH